MWLTQVNIISLQSVMASETLALELRDGPLKAFSVCWLHTNIVTTPNSTKMSNTADATTTTDHVGDKLSKDSYKDYRDVMSMRRIQNNNVK